MKHGAGQTLYNHALSEGDLPTLHKLEWPQCNKSLIQPGFIVHPGLNNFVSSPISEWTQLTSNLPVDSGAVFTRWGKDHVELTPNWCTEEPWLTRTFHHLEGEVITNVYLKIRVIPTRQPATCQVQHFELWSTRMLIRMYLVNTWSNIECLVQSVKLIRE